MFFGTFLSRNVKKRHFLSRKTGFRAVSQKNGKFALQADCTFYPALADRIMAPLVAEKSRHTLVVLLEPFHIGIHETHIV